jgi:hypothetical protein
LTSRFVPATAIFAAGRPALSVGPSDPPELPVARGRVAGRGGLVAAGASLTAPGGFDDIAAGLDARVPPVVAPGWEFVTSTDADTAIAAVTAIIAAKIRRTLPPSARDSVTRPDLGRPANR